MECHDTAGDAVRARLGRFYGEVTTAHGSIAVTERAILTLKHEWLRRVAVIRGIDHLTQLLNDFSEYYNHWRGHSTIGGAVPSVIHRGEAWQRPDRSAKTVSGTIERRLFPDTRVTAFRLAA
jgi:transposase InsO family protein